MKAGEKGGTAEEELSSQELEEDEKIMPLIERAINQYKGHFLTDEREEFWTTSYRERLRSMYLRLIIRAGDYLERAGRWESAAEHYLKGLEVDDLAEEFYQHLMICYKELGQHAKAIETYRLCKKTLLAALGIEPSPKTEAIYSNLKENTKS
jgi:two-component SAPR family response regulator